MPYGFTPIVMKRVANALWFHSSIRYIYPTTPPTPAIGRLPKRKKKRLKEKDVLEDHAKTA